MLFDKCLKHRQGCGVIVLLLRDERNPEFRIRRLGLSGEFADDFLVGCNRIIPSFGVLENVRHSHLGYDAFYRAGIFCEEVLECFQALVGLPEAALGERLVRSAEASEPAVRVDRQ